MRQVVALRTREDLLALLQDTYLQLITIITAANIDGWQLLLMAENESMNIKETDCSIIS